MPAASMMRTRLPVSSSSHHLASSASRGRAADRSGETHHTRRDHAASREQRESQQRSYQASRGGKARAISNLFSSKPRHQQQQQQHWTRTKQDAMRTTETASATATATDATEKPRKVWKSAVDAKTGRTYYYDSVTRQTQWNKPLELATDEERRVILEKEKKQSDFFAAMEENILKSMAGGSLVPAASTKNRSSASVGSNGSSRSGSASGDEEDREEGIAEMSMRSRGTSQSTSASSKKGALLPKGFKPTSKPVRTISSMDNALLAELAKTGQKAEGLPFDTIVSSTKISPHSVSSFPFGSASEASESDGKSQLVSHLNSTFPPPMKRSSSGIRTPPKSEDDKAVDEFRRTAEEMAAMTLNDGERRTGGDSTAAARSSTPSPSLSELKSIPKPTFQQRNTCGTLYVSSTMSDPDKDATIKCVCGIYRAHILQAAHEEAASGFRPQVKFDEYEIFNDLRSERGAGLAKEVSISPSCIRSSDNPSYDTRDEAPKDLDPSIEAYTAESIESIVPSLDEIAAFYCDVFRRSQMETDCIIMSLIYIERLIKITVGGVRPRIGNWRSVLFASMVMSSKVWDDLSMWNADFSQTCPSGVRFPLKRINELELAMLNCLKFDVKVQASEYAKYYFLLRSMCIRSGLAGHDLIHARALDIEGARKIEDLSSKFQHDGMVGVDTNKSGTSNSPSTKALGSRSKSTGEVVEASSPNTGAAKVNLEKIVQM